MKFKDFKFPAELIERLSVQMAERALERWLEELDAAAAAGTEPPTAQEITNPPPAAMPERPQKRFMSRQEISSYLRQQYGIELSVEAIRQRDYRNQGPGGYLLGRRRVSTPEQVDQWVTDVLLKPIRSDL